MKQKQKKKHVQTSSSSTQLHTLAQPFEKSLKVKDAWFDVLSVLNKDVTSGVISYLLRTELSDAERQQNADLLLSFYVGCDKLKELIDLCVEMDYFLKVNDKTKYSPYTNLLMAIVLRSCKDQFQEFQQLLIKRVQKLKGVSLDDKKTSTSDKDLMKVKELLNSFVEGWMTQNFPTVVMYIWSKQYQTFSNKIFTKDDVYKTMENYMFLSPFNSFVYLWMNQTESVQSIILFSRLMQSLFVTTQTDSYWKLWMKQNSQDLLKQVFKFVWRIKDLEVEPNVAVSQIPRNVKGLVDFLNTEESKKGVKNYISEYGIRLLLLTGKTDERSVKLQSVQAETYSLLVASMNDKLNFLQQMSIMKMRIKDLHEERRYLRQLLGPEYMNDEHDEEQEEKDEN
ncbi:hypothetical protein EIN_379290 [Entamoeba invadens IP1]|uniref:Uncharacterized protein n=1 Tax=Entamoeba invadens IP1 TaxID=370355 RepID=A0A0A1UAJ6_ENTIV|nr:hypothetical protein EIN_379290 [Entamoeba invadens IP1]ELP92062.1 hypothetical protein EIN_379290 [Entamoeba invadens IP1]|eukprot:XP_004258833.1 hypothetical protein EIN_379290 [Entamoeba invadens IP1]